ncbi:transposase-like protein [Paenibacillus shirakamiensis]|uniref:Transposase-like protein n=1 Tax=Paenibacillus shirakamiensis TaxID=1265935 RepID=A0ABS4JGE3_9BACL|nr:transposase-like protein [Paenibacillus shirakamiensis]
MNVLTQLRVKYGVYCPTCKKELNIYQIALDKSIMFFKCTTCDIYYERRKGEEALTETLYPVLQNKTYFKNNPHIDSYHGWSSSLSFAPKWLVWLEFKLK